METVYVIGSGPAGVAAACGLLERQDVHVVMLDVGKSLESDKLENRLNTHSPIIYPDSHLPWEKNTKHFNKHLFGSIYPYDIDDYADFFDLNNVMMRASFAKGGLSNIWGASIIPYKKSEIQNWPISTDEMFYYYKKVLKFIPLSTCLQDDLSDWPTLHDQPTKYMLSQQAQHLWNCYVRSQKNLNASGIKAGGARLAIYQNAHANGSGCTQCGECMYGCTNDAIYSTRHTLADLKKNQLFQYLPNIRVDQLAESDHSVAIEAYDIKQKTSVSFKAKRVFLAAGVMMSAHILMKSFSWLHETELSIADSQHFFLPGLMLRHIKNTRNQPSHTLCQLLYEIKHPSILNESVQLQLYTYISLYEKEFENKIKYLKHCKKFLHPFYERLIVMQGYLPSRVSGRITMRYRSSDKKFIIAGHPNEESKIIIKKITRLLLRLTLRLGCVPLLPFCQVGPVGCSNHYGGTFPMKKQTANFNESDCQGTPAGLKRIHLVDASVLPSIQAQSITLAIMANAYRIGNTVNID